MPRSKGSSGSASPIKISFGQPVDESIVSPSRNTQAQSIAQQVAEAFRKIPNGQALPLQTEGAKKHFRFGLQKRLQKMGLKVQVIFGQNDTLYVKRAQ